MEEKLEIKGLGILSGHALQHELSVAGVSFETKQQDHGGYGELATLTVVAVLGAPLVVALSAWLLKTRRGETIRLSVRRRHRDGTEEEVDFEHTVKNEAEPKQELINALTSALTASSG